MRILVCEDDKDSQKLLVRILEKANHEVVTADDGQEAWQTFQRGDFRLVITDWIMPRMKGLELCEKIRAKQTPGYVYIILVTSKEEKQDLMHVAVCRLLSYDGYYEFVGRDADGYPHFELLRPVKVNGVKEQEQLLKEKVIQYFKNWEEE